MLMAFGNIRQQINEDNKMSQSNEEFKTITSTNNQFYMTVETMYKTFRLDT